MNRLTYILGLAYVLACGVAIVRHMTRAPIEYPAATIVPTALGSSPGTSGAGWFAAMKPYCNTVEVEVRHRYTPPPPTSEGAGYSAACFALAGKIERARQVIEGMPSADRPAAAGVLFEVGHPVADAGDDRAAGPMMELVIAYWPENYMALYHAGMSQSVLGQPEPAKRNLRRFLELYDADDGFTGAARATLRKLERGEQP